MAKFDVEELRSRISNLENLTFSNSGVNGGTNPVNRISELENLLASSEIEQQSLIESHESSLIAHKSHAADLNEELHRQKLDIKEYKAALTLAIRDKNKAEERAERIEAYLSTLPSREEMIEAEEKAATLLARNEVLEQRLVKARGRAGKLQEDLFHLQELHEEALIRLEEAKSNEDINDGGLLIESRRLKSLVENLRKRDEKSSSECKELRGTIELLSFEREKKDEELYQMNASRKATEKALKESLSRLASKEEELEKALDELKEAKNREEDESSLKTLMAQLDLTLSDLTRLVDLAEEMVMGKTPDVDLLIGIPAHVNGTDEEFSIPKAIVTVGNVRRRVDEIREKFGEVYGRLLGSDLENCMLQ